MRWPLLRWPACLATAIATSIALPFGPPSVARDLGSPDAATSLAAPAAHPASPHQDLRTTLGTPELVMDYATMTCRRGGGLDLPDVQAHALRRPDGSLLLVSGNATINFSMAGPDFDHLTRDCAPLLVSGDSPVASSFDNQEWLLSVFREGDIVHGLVHNEYHDPAAANCRPGVTDPSNPCWYNAITYARSTDGGHSFSQAPAPDHVVAALPYPWDPTATRRGAPPPHGYFTPSNIVRGPDQAYYSLFMAISDRATSAQGQCLMRSDNLSDPAGWRAWDGAGFNLPMPSPYDAAGNPAPTGRPACTPVSPGVIGGMGGSLTYNSYMQQYLLVGSGVFDQAGAQVCGTGFSLSTDLVTWSTPRLLMPGKLPYPPCTDGSPDGSLIYPSLIDHADTDVNFQNTGATPHLYFVRWNQGLDRDLLRVPVTFSLAEPGDPTGTPAPSATPTAPTRRSPTPTSGRPIRMTPTPTATRPSPPALLLPWLARGAATAHAVADRRSGRVGGLHRSSPSPWIAPRSSREASLATLASAISESDRSSSVAICVRYHSTSPNSCLSASRSASETTPPLSRKSFLTLPATSPASLVRPRVG